jgi:hypothetical protein
VELAGLERKDELGQIVQAVQRFKAGAAERAATLDDAVEPQRRQRRRRPISSPPSALKSERR